MSAEGRRGATWGLIVVLLVTAAPALAAFGSSSNVGANVFSTATLAAPGNVSPVAACETPTTAQVTVSWSVSASAFADGYDVLGSGTANGPHPLIAHVAGGSSTSYLHTGQALGVTLYYVVRATAYDWVSSLSAEASVVTPATCP